MQVWMKNHADELTVRSCLWQRFRGGIFGGSAGRLWNRKLDARVKLQDWTRGLLLHQQDLLGAVDLGQLDLDDLVHGGLHDAANEGGLNRQFPMSAIDQNAELHSAWPAMRKQGIERRADGSASEKDVIDQNDAFVLDVETDFRLLDNRFWPQCRKVVAVEGDIQRPHRDRRAFHALHDLAEPLRKGNTATTNAD